MSQTVPPPYGYPHQIHAPRGSNQVIQVYQDGGFTRVATQQSYPAQSEYPGFVRSPHQNYPGSNGTAQQNQPAIYEINFVNYAQQSAKGLGIAQMVLGTVLVVLNIVLIAITGTNITYHSAGYGIWGGALFTSAGVLGVISAKRSTNRTILPTMVLSIISASIAPAIFALGIANINYLGSNNNNNIYYYKSHYYENYNNYNGGLSTPGYLTRSGMVAVTVISVVMSMLTAAEMTVAIVASAVCCRAICSGDRNAQPYRRLTTTSAGNFAPVPSDGNNHTLLQSGVPFGFAGTTNGSPSPVTY